MASSNLLTKKILKGLLKHPKELPSEILYDATGVFLFSHVLKQPEYYLSRHEMFLIQKYSREILSELRSQPPVWMELGSGTGEKTLFFLKQVQQDNVHYIPTDLSQKALAFLSQKIKAHVPHVHLHPLCQNFRKKNFFQNFQKEFSQTPSLVLILGSTLGNLSPMEAQKMLKHTASILRTEGYLLVGLDLQKEASKLIRAYQDEAGWNAAFCLNAIRRLKREWQLPLSEQDFLYQPRWNAAYSRMEMTLIAKKAFSFLFQGHTISFHKKEPWIVAYSYKYSFSQLSQLFRKTPFKIRKTWTTPPEDYLLLLAQKYPVSPALSLSRKKIA